MSVRSQAAEWAKLKEALLNRHSKKMNIILDTLQDEEFAVQYFKLLEFVVPKLQRQEVELDTKDDLVLKVEYVKSEADESKGNKDTDSGNTSGGGAIYDTVPE